MDVDETGGKDKIEGGGRLRVEGRPRCSAAITAATSCTRAATCRSRREGAQGRRALLLLHGERREEAGEVDLSPESEADEAARRREQAMNSFPPAAAAEGTRTIPMMPALTQSQSMPASSCAAPRPMPPHAPTAAAGSSGLRESRREQDLKADEVVYANWGSSLWWPARIYGEFKDAKDAVTSSRDREMLERMHSSDYKFKNKTVWLVWYFNWPEELINEDNDDIGGGGWGLITSKEDMSLSTQVELQNEEGGQRKVPAVGRWRALSCRCGRRRLRRRSSAAGSK